MEYPGRSKWHNMGEFLNIALNATHGATFQTEPGNTTRLLGLQIALGSYPSVAAAPRLYRCEDCDIVDGWTEADIALRR
jgi:hypothetical protein